jgi:hypothetical protein
MHKDSNLYRLLEDAQVKGQSVDATRRLLTGGGLSAGVRGATQLIPSQHTPGVYLTPQQHAGIQIASDTFTRQ